MSTEMNDQAKSKSPQPVPPISKPPPVPPPPVPNPVKSKPLPIINGNRFKKVNPIKPHHISQSLSSSPIPTHTNLNNGAMSTQVALHPLPNGTTDKPIQTDIAKWHRFGTLLLGSDTTKTNEVDTTPTLQPANTTKTHILNTKQRDILANTIITILSNTKSKKIPNLLPTASRKSSCNIVYSSEMDSDQGSEDNDIQNSDHSDLSEIMEAMAQELTHNKCSSPEPDFVEHVTPIDKDDSLQNLLNIHETDKQTLAKVVVSQKEKLILMSSIAKYIESQHEMDTIHRACFNLWKDWYRCYGTITNQFQAAFMKVCEKLLGNVDSRALAREPPLTSVNNKSDDSKSIEEITYILSTQISTLKHAFAVEQLIVNKNGSNDVQNVPQIIDGMEPNVWLIVKHIILEYLKSVYWVQSKYTLFNLFLSQYESVNRKLDREFISTSSFGVYTLICQLSNVLDAFSDINIQQQEVQDPTMMEDGFNLDQSTSDTVLIKERLIMIKEEDIAHTQTMDNRSSSSNDNVELFGSTFSNDELLETLNWYYSICRLETLLSNKREDYLTLQMYRLYKPMFDAVFRYFEKHNDDDNIANVLSLIQSIVDETDYIIFKARYDLILREIKDEKKGILIRPSTPNRKKEKQTNFVALLSRVIDSCMNWICKDLYFNYRTSEFCMLLTQLLADPAAFKVKKEQSRSVRIIRLHERFNLPSDQPLVNSYICALDTGKFLHQGRIYFFKDYLCFYANMWGIKDTQQKFLLPVTEIKTVARKVTAWVFNNAIEIQMKDGRTFTFRTFMKRDATFELLQKLINGQIDWEAVEKQEQKEREKEKEKEDEHMKKEEQNGSKTECEDSTMQSGKHNNKSASNLKKKNVINEISGFVMSAIDVSSSKLLSTDAKLLLQSKNKRKDSRDRKNSKQKNELQEVVEMKNMTKDNDMVYSGYMNGENEANDSNDGSECLPVPARLVVTRSAPMSPIKRIELQHIKKPSSDSETAEHIADIVMDDDTNESAESSVYSSTHRSDIEQSESEIQLDHMDDDDDTGEETDESKREIDVVRTEMGEDSTFMEDKLNEECEGMNSMDCKWILEEKPKVEKDFEVMLEYEFKGIGVDEFFDKFWSNNAIFSPIDWTKADSMNSDIKTDEWTPDAAPNNGEQWYNLNVSCVTKLEDLPAFFPKSISQCTSETLLRYCKLGKYFYVVHKNMCVNDIPFADCYNTHQKLEMKQSATVVNTNDKPGISLSTHITMSFGVEWKKSTWLKSPVRSRTLLSVKQDNIKWCEEIKRRISAMSEQEQEIEEIEEIQRDNVNIVIKNKKEHIVKKKKRRTKMKIKSNNKGNKASLLVQKMKRNVTEHTQHSEDDYDFVFKIGNNNSLLRCRLLLACCTKSAHADKDKKGSSTCLIVLLVVLSICIILFCLYAVGIAITLISSVMTVLTSSAEYIHQISSQLNHAQYPSHLQRNQYIFEKTYDPIQHINQHIMNDCIHQNETDNDECMLYIKHCDELMDLISINPSSDILHKTYDSLNCVSVLNNLK